MRFGRPHWRSLLYGSLASIGVAAARLALPWPLRSIVETVFADEKTSVSFLGIDVTRVGDPLILFCSAYVLIAISTGFFEMIQRLWMARFAGSTAHDLRAVAVAGIGSTPATLSSDGADLITRIIGDVARLKADLKGILIHVTQNGLLLIAITLVFLTIAPVLGFLFLAGGLSAVVIGALTVDEVEQTARKQRKKESQYAARIPAEREWGEDLESAELNASSVRKEVRTTRLMGQATWLAHVVVASIISVALWVGVREVRAGVLAPGDIFLFIAYALIVHRRAVRVGRQVARSGKVLACVSRIGELIAPVESAGGRRAVGSGVPTIEMREVRVRANSSHVRRTCLGPLDLAFPPATKTLVLGSPGAGISTLLGLIAGRVHASKGSICWDGEDVTDSLRRMHRSVALLEQSPVVKGRTTPRSLLGLEHDEALPDEAAQILELFGARALLGKLVDGLNAAIESQSLSNRECRALVLAGILRSDAPIWVLDWPVLGNTRIDRDRMGCIIERADGHTLVVGQQKACLVDAFDRVLYLRKGRVAFEGTPADWTTWREMRRSQTKTSRNKP